MKKKWNISILIIFVLLSCSLIGVLAMNFVKQILNYSGQVHNYYKSYYIAKWWLELWLVQVTNSDFGFSYSINSWSELLADNLACDGCFFDLNVMWSAEYINNEFRISDECIDTNALFLSGGDTFILPLWQYNIDNSVLPVNEDKRNIADYLKRVEYNTPNDLYGDKELTLWIASFRDWEVYNDMIRYNKFSNTKYIFDQFVDWLDFELWDLPDDVDTYLLISNNNLESELFCLSSDTVLPTQTSYISSLGDYWSKRVGLKAVYQRPIPYFLLHTYIEN